MDNSRARLDSELLYLIYRHLASGPCARTAQALKEELEENQLLPSRFDWTGRQRYQQLSALDQRLSHIQSDHLPRLLESFVQLWNNACNPPVPGLTSLFNAGAVSLLNATQEHKPIIRPPDALLVVHHSRPAPSLERHAASITSLLKARRVTGIFAQKHMLHPVNFYSKFKKYRRLMGHLCASYCVLYDRTGTRVLTGADDCLLKIWSAHDGRLVSTLRGHQSEVADIAVDLENRLIASGGCDKVIRVWNLQTRAPVAVLLGHSGVITSLQFCPYPSRAIRYLVSTGADGNVCFWEYNPTSFTFCLNPTKFVERGKPGDQILCSSFSAGGCLLVCGGTDHVVRLYQSQPGPPERLAELDGHTDRVQTVQFAHKGNRFVSGGRDGSARIWSHTGSNWKCVVLSMHTRLADSVAPKVNKLNVTMVAWDLIDEHIITASNDTILKVWNPDTGVLIHEMRGHEDVVFVLEAHPIDERILMSAGHDGVIALWNLCTGTMIKRFENRYHGNGVASVFDCKFSPDGLSMACCDSQGQVSFFGVPDTKAFEKVPDQQFFHTDYHPLVRDIHNHVLDEQTELPPHAMPPPYLVNMDCNPYPPELQRLVTGYVRPVVAVAKKECSEEELYQGIDVAWPEVNARRQVLVAEKQAREQRFKREREAYAAARKANHDLTDSEESEDDELSGLFPFKDDLHQGPSKRRRSMSIVSGEFDGVLSPPPPGPSSATRVDSATTPSATAAAPATPGSAVTPLLAPRSGSMLDSFVLPLQSAPVVSGRSSVSAGTGDGTARRAATPMRALRSPPPMAGVAQPGSVPPLSGFTTTTGAAATAAGGTTPVSALGEPMEQVCSSNSSIAVISATMCSSNTSHNTSPALGNTMARDAVAATTPFASTTAVAASSAASHAVTPGELPIALVHPLCANSPVREFPASSADAVAVRDAAVDYASTGSMDRNRLAAASSAASASDTPTVTSLSPSTATAAASALSSAGVAATDVTGEEPMDTSTSVPDSQQPVAAAATASFNQAAPAMPLAPVAAVASAGVASAAVAAAGVGMHENGDGDGDGDDEESEAEQTDAQRATSMAERYVRQQHAANTAVLLHKAATDCPSVDVLLEHWKKRPAAPPLDKATLRVEEERRVALGEEELKRLIGLKQSSFLPFSSSGHSPWVTLFKGSSFLNQQPGVFGGPRTEITGNRSALGVPQIDVIQATPRQPPPRRRARANGPANAQAAPGYRLSSRSDSNRSIPANNGSRGDSGSDNGDDSDVHISLDEMSGSSSSSMEESDCSDWSEDAGIARAARAAARRRAAESERQAQAASSQNATASSRPAKKKKAPPKKEPVRQVDPAELQRFWPSNWITSTEPLPQPYFPQQGDKIFYCRQGHESYIDSITENNVHRVDKKMLPWTKKKFPVRDHEVCYVVNVHFVVGPPTLCNLKLRVISSAPNRPDRSTFSIQYHDYDNVPDFIVLYSRVKEALECQWKAGDHFRSMIDGQYWTGTILERRPFQADHPDSLWQCYDVRWDGGETELLSPWDMERIDGAQAEGGRGASASGNRLGIRTRRQSAAVANEMNMGSIQASIDAQNWILPGEEEVEECWASENADAASARICAGLEKVQESLDIAQPFAYSVDYREAYPEYCVCVAFPTCLDMIISKLKHKFYRRVAAVLWEARLLQKNAKAFNEEDSEIVHSSQALVTLLCKFIKTPSCTDPVELYHSGALLDEDMEEDGEELAAGASATSPQGLLSLSTSGAAGSAGAASSLSAVAASHSNSRLLGSGSNASADGSSHSSGIRTVRRRTRAALNGSVAANGFNASSSSEDDEPEPVRITRGNKHAHNEAPGECPNQPLTPDLYQFCSRLIEDIAVLDPARVFQEPVDLKSLPDYLQYVTHPIDFKTLSERMLRGEYATIPDFCRALVMIFNNSRLYNSQKSSEVYKLTSRLWRKYDDLVLDFLRDCNNGQDLPDIGIIPKKNSRRSAQHAKKALKRRRQDSSSACTSSSSSSDPDDSACDGQNNNSSADSDEDEDDASEQESEEELDENATGESSEEKEDEEDDDDGPRRRRSAARSHRKPAAAAATAAATPARNCRAPAKPVKATPRTPAKPPLKLKIKVTQQQQPQQAPPAKRQRRAAQRATYFDDSSDGEENFTPASAAVSSADSVPSNEVTGTSRSGRTIKRNSRFRQM